MEKSGLFAAQPEHSHILELGAKPPDPRTPRVARRRVSALRAVLFVGAMLLPGCAPHTPAIHAFTHNDGMNVQLATNVQMVSVSAPLVHAAAMEAVAAPAAELDESNAPAPATVSSIAANVKALMPASAAQYVPIIETAASRRGIPANLLTAALSRESANFRERYVRGYHVDGTGRGMAGIDKVYHPEVSDEQALDPEYAIHWMAAELSDLIKKHAGDAYSAVREYNGGPRFASDRIGYGGTPVSELTRRHAEAIFAYAGGA